MKKVINIALIWTVHHESSAYQPSYYKCNEDQ